MEYKGPAQGTSEYRSKFLRVGDALHVTRPGNTQTLHDELGIKDGIHNQIKQLRQTDPTKVDGGGFYVNNDAKEIIIYGKSSGYDLPVLSVVEETTRITVEAFIAQSPEYTVASIR